MAKTTKNEQSVAETTEQTMTKGKALEVLVAYVMANDPTPELTEACKLARPSYFGMAERANNGDGLIPSYRRFFQLFGDLPNVGDSVTEEQAFSVLKAGRHEMRIITNELIKYPCAGTPVYWLTLADGKYTVAHIGPEAPEGWTGYLPKYLNNGKARMNKSK
jgi:hypothetical protein